VLAVILALVAGMVTGAAAQTTDEVRIGIVSPLTGARREVRPGPEERHDHGAEDVNNAGGHQVARRSQDQAVFGDTRGEADTGVTETERLITRDKVHALIGAFQSGVGFPSSAMAEKHQVPWLTFGTFDKITERGFKYVFRAHANDSIKAKTLIDGLVALGKKAGPIKSAVIMSENTEWGKSVGEKQKNFLEKLGVKVHFVENYPYASPDLTSLIVKAKAVSPDLVVADSYLGDALLITRQMAEQELRPVVYAAGGGGHVQPDFLKGAGKLSEGIFAATMWDAAVGKNVPWIAKDNDRHVARFGAPFTEDSAGYYQGFYVIVDALERTKKLGTKELRDAIAATNITDINNKAMFLPYKQIKFDDGGQNPFATAMVVQTQGGKFRLLYPETVASPTPRSSGRTWAPRSSAVTAEETTTAVRLP
jgi:branched-chain amino acid transport system substrate-binding protein